MTVLRFLAGANALSRNFGGDSFTEYIRSLTSHTYYKPKTQVKLIRATVYESPQIGIFNKLGCILI